MADSSGDFLVVLIGVATGIAIAFSASGLGMYLTWKKRQRDTPCAGMLDRLSHRRR